MSTIELNNRKYTLIEEIMGIENDAIIEKIEKLVANEKKSTKSPIAYTLEEIKQEVAEAEKETGIYYIHSCNRFLCSQPYQERLYPPVSSIRKILKHNRPETNHRTI